MVLAHKGRIDEALAEFSNAGCRQSDARVNLAYCLMAQKDWAGAQQQFQLAMTVDPRSQHVQDGLAHFQSSVPQTTTTCPEMRVAAKQPQPTRPETQQSTTDSPSSVQARPADLIHSMAAPRPTSEIRIVEHTESVQAASP
jgi:hypothetical protein